MSGGDERERVLAYLARREEVARDTQRALREQEVAPSAGLEGVSPDAFAALEAEFYAAKGRERYVTSDGRVLWLTPEQIAQRAAQRASRKGRRTGYGPELVDRRWLVGWAFNVFAVLLAFILVYLVIF